MENKQALNPTVVKLGLVSLFADVSSEMLYPITPIFLTMVLGASVFDVGLIEGFAEGTASLMKTYSGRWSDRIQNRRTFVWVGYLFAGLAKPLIGLASSWPMVLFARSFDRFGKGLRSSPRDALLADATADDVRGAAFGWHRAMDTLGAAIGPLLALAFLHFYQKPEQMRDLYYWAVVPGLLSVLLVFLVKEKKAKPKEIKPFEPFRLSLFSSAFKSYLFAWGLFSLANSSDVFLLLKAQKSGLSLSTTIILYASYNLIYAFASPYLGGLSDRIGRKKVLIAGLVVFAFVYSLFGFATELWQFAGLFLVYGLYMAATDGVGKAFAVDLVPKHLKATGVGMLGTVSGLATICASSVAGFMWDAWGAESAFLFGAAGALLAAAIMAIKIQESQSQSA